MNHQDHVQLIRAGVAGQLWADMGAGTGAFTLALAELLGKEGVIYAIDRDGGALNTLRREMQTRFPHTRLHSMTADFSQALELPPLDGIVMANSLHFIQQKEPVLRQIQTYLKDTGRLILVEYGSDAGNAWVPYPLTYVTWEKLAQKVGFGETSLIGSRPSRFLGEIYSAVSLR